MSTQDLEQLYDRYLDKFVERDIDVDLALSFKDFVEYRSKIKGIL